MTRSPFSGLPAPAKAAARRNLTDALVHQYGWTKDQTYALTDTVVDPADLRSAVNDNHDHQVLQFKAWTPMLAIHPFRAFRVGSPRPDDTRPADAETSSPTGLLTVPGTDADLDRWSAENVEWSGTVHALVNQIATDGGWHNRDDLIVAPVTTTDGTRSRLAVLHGVRRIVAARQILAYRLVHHPDFAGQIDPDQVDAMMAGNFEALRAVVSAVNDLDDAGAISRSGRVVPMLMTVPVHMAARRDDRYLLDLAEMLFHMHSGSASKPRLYEWAFIDGELQERDRTYTPQVTADDAKAEIQALLNLPAEHPHRLNLNNWDAGAHRLLVDEGLTTDDAIEAAVDEDTWPGVDSNARRYAYLCCLAAQRDWQPGMLVQVASALIGLNRKVGFVAQAHAIDQMWRLTVHHHIVDTLKAVFPADVFEPGASLGPDGTSGPFGFHPDTSHGHAVLAVGYFLWSGQFPWGLPADGANPWEGVYLWLASRAGQVQAEEIAVADYAATVGDPDIRSTPALVGDSRDDIIAWVAGAPKTATFEEIARRLLKQATERLLDRIEDMD
jgi:hypothetical protein